MDYNEQDRVVAVEMLYLSKRASDTEIHRLLFESVPRQVEGEIRHGGFANWQWAVSKQPGDVADILKRCAA